MRWLAAPVVLVCLTGGGAGLGRSAAGPEDCCELCRKGSGCGAAVWRPSTATCFLQSEYALDPATESGDNHLACINPSRGTAKTPCNFLGGRDYRATRAATLKRVRSQDECCAACFAWSDCKVGLWDKHWNECYLKGGFVKELPGSSKDITVCSARPNPLPAPEFDCLREGANCAGRIGATNWGPCYALNESLPSLIDGARSIHAMGSRVIKVALFRPRWHYPFNSPLWPMDDESMTPEAVAKHPYFQALWEMDFDSYVLVAYSSVGGNSSEYWVEGITREQEEEEEKQFYAVTSYLLREYPKKTFVLQNTEGDWASRGGQRPSTPAAPSALSSMSRWLKARQAGVTRARRDLRSGGTMGNVYLAVEVNLVFQSIRAVAPCVLDQVLPKIAVDMVSYSSYDSQQVLPDFQAAMAFIRSFHRRTNASPPGASALLVGEFGLPQRTVPPEDVRRVVGDVVNSALAFGASFILFWEVYCNECTKPGEGGCGHDARCHDPLRPVTLPEQLQGFWLVRPDGSYSWPREYLSAKLGGASLEALQRLRAPPRAWPLAAAWAVGAGLAALAAGSVSRACWRRYRKGYTALPSRESSRFEEADYDARTVGAPCQPAEEDIFAIN